MRVSIFAIEVCVRMDLARHLHERLRARTVAALPAPGFQEKWDFYTGCADVLRGSLGAAERGCWDFFENDGRARSDFDMWKGGMVTREGVRSEPSGPVDPYRGTPRYLTFTMAMLLVYGTPSERMMAGACNIPDAQLWHRSSFDRVLRAISSISFSSVYSDVAYLIPRDEPWALTEADLSEEKFEYLRRIV